MVYAMTTLDEQARPVVIRAGEGARLVGRPSTVTLKVGVEDSMGFAMAVFEAAPGFEAPRDLHGHTREDHAVYVLEGEVAFATDDGELRVAAGDAVLFPRGTRFAWSNRGAQTSRHLAVWCPAGFERFFSDLGEAVRVNPEVVGDPRAMGRIVRPLWERYGIR
jgi:quercetin dioxygenase-like cupin family protein